MSQDHPITVSFNTAVQGKYTGQDWAWYNRQFRATDTTARGLAVSIWKGFAFAPVYRQNRRVKANFIKAHHIAFDFDTADERSSLVTLTDDQLYRDYGAFCYSTPSSQPDAPKSRMVYIFTEPITDLDRYEKLYRALLWGRYSVRPLADASTKDAARLFFGSVKCTLEHNWKLLPTDIIDDLILCYDAHLDHTTAQKKTRVMVVKPHAGKGIFSKYLEKLLTNITGAADGEKHRVLTKNAYAIGGYVAGGYIDRTEAQLRLLEAVNNMSGVDDMGKAENTAVESLEAGMGEPLFIERTLDYVISEV